VIVHAASEQQARELWAAIASRLAECGLELNEHKTRGHAEITNDCAAAPLGRAGSSPRSTNASPACSLTGGSARAQTAGRWEPDDGRLSRPVLRAPGGATPPGDSPDHRRRQRRGDRFVARGACQLASALALAGFRAWAPSVSCQDSIGTTSLQLRLADTPCIGLVTPSRHPDHSDIVNLVGLPPGTRDPDGSQG